MVFNGGIGSQSSTQVKDRMLAFTGRHSDPTVIWAGRNNYSDPTTVKADIAAMVAELDTDNYLVLGVHNGAGEGTATTAYGHITGINADLAATYGSKFWDTRAYLLTRGDGSAQDNTDIADGIVPTSKRSDTLHLNAAGYTLIAAGIVSRMGL
jgi:hypothetical protein